VQGFAYEGWRPGDPCRRALGLAVTGNDGSGQVRRGYLQLGTLFQLDSDVISSPTVDLGTSR